MGEVGEEIKSLKDTLVAHVITKIVLQVNLEEFHIEFVYYYNYPFEKANAHVLLWYPNIDLSELVYLRLSKMKNL